MWNLALIFPIKPRLLIGRRIEVVVRVDQLATLALSEHDASRHDTSGDERPSTDEKTTARQLVVTSWMVMPARVSNVTIVNHGRVPPSAAIGLRICDRSRNATTTVDGTAMSRKRRATSLPRETPRLCRGGSSGLTFKGVHRRNSQREPPSTRKG